jgi:beta-galactosidase
MKTTSFNEGWSVGPRWSLFTAGTGPTPEPAPVTLPHDAVIGLTRDAGESGATGFFPGGAFEYTKTFDVPDDWAGRRVVLRFEGVYRSAVVYVNDDFAGSQPSGYSELLVPLDEHLRFGEPNTIKVQPTVHDDSRWYSGGGIYREVSLLLGPEAGIAPDGATITAPEVDEAGAMVVVATEVENRPRHTRSVRVAMTLTGAVVAEQEVRLTVRPGTTADAHQRIHLVDPPRWSVEEPHLHACRTRRGSAGAALTSGSNAGPGGTT